MLEIDSKPLLFIVSFQIRTEMKYKELKARNCWMLNLTAYLDGILSLKSAKYPLFYNIIINYFTIDF